MAVDDSEDTAGRLAEQDKQGDPDLLPSMVKTMTEPLISAEVDGLCS